MSQKYLYLPRVRLYSDNQRDKDIQNWLKDLPSGIKSETIKQAMWASISDTSSRPPTYLREQPYYNPDRQAIPTSSKMNASLTFDTHELLVDIRQIVEVAVTQALAHHGTSATSVEPPKASSDIEAMLDNLDISFMLEDDDEEES